MAVRRRREVTPRGITLRSLPTILGALALSRALAPAAALPTISDRRFYDPAKLVRPAFVTFGPRDAARVVVRQNRITRTFSPPYALAFRVPMRVDLCRRRKTRRQVLHALRVAGGTGFRRRRHDPWSEVHC